MFPSPPYHNSYFPSYDPYYNKHRYFDPERAHALAAQRAKRAQWLPDEVGDFEDDEEYNQIGPQERAWLNAHQNQTAIERERQRRLQRDESRKRAEEELRWQQQLDGRQKEDQEVRRRLEEEKERRRRVQQQQQTQRDRETRTKLEHKRGRSRSRSRSRGPTPNGHVPSPQPSAPDQAPDQRTSPKSPLQPPIPPTPVSQYDQEHVDAASTLQRRFRIRQSFRAISSLSSQFRTLRKEFTPPSILSFQNPSSPPNSTDVIDIPSVSPSEVDSVDMDADDSMDVDSDASIPKLAFNSTNYALHAYRESLDKLLIELDGVESWGDQNVRARRRAVVKRIEGEQARLDKLLKDSWTEYIQQTEAKS